MKNNELSQIWKSQKVDFTLDKSEDIVKKAQKQRNGQLTSITVLSISVIVLIVYTIKYAGSGWNNFTLGLMLMISSITVRLVIEYSTIYRKKRQLVLLDNRSFQRYLDKYYRMRIKINYIITPLCFAVYVYGFLKLIPYFKNEFSTAFYTYIVISGIISLVALSALIINSIITEKNFLRQLNRK